MGQSGCVRVGYSDRIITAERAKRDERKEIVHVGQMCSCVCVCVHVCWKAPVIATLKRCT